MEELLINYYRNTSSKVRSTQSFLNFLYFNPFQKNIFRSFGNSTSRIGIRSCWSC